MGGRSKDRHKQNKNRHKPGYIRPSRRNPDAPDVPRPKGRPPGPPKPPKEPKPPRIPKPKGWKGKFISVDGEGWDGKFTLLACSAHKYDLYHPDGLPTRSCLRYLTDWGVKGGDALVGFGLSYDFENILRDVPDDDYKLLMDGEAIDFHEYTIKYIPRKILEIKKDLGKTDDNGKPRFKTVFLQDTMGYFQTSFEKALKKFELEIPPIITEGKAMRGDFSKAPLAFIKAYNREELRLHVEMMEIVRLSGKEAFEAIGLEAQATPRTWFGPGAWASSFLKQTDWLGEHPPFRGEAFETLLAEMRDYVTPYISELPPKEYFQHVQEIKDAQAYAKAIIQNYYAGLVELNKNDPYDLGTQIKARGGIAPSKSGVWAGEYAERIPRALKRKKGLPLDQMADELNMTAADLLDAIQAIPPKKSSQDLKTEAEQLAGYDPHYEAILQTIERLEESKALITPEIPRAALLELENLNAHPFAAAFYGGRIESAAVGEFLEEVYDYDVNSAYPFALANFPKWNPDNLVRTDTLDGLARIGMYYIEWDCPPGAGFYPFPYRSATGNVFYPPRGKGWYMTPEIYAALDVWGPECITVKQGYILEGTDGCGDGLHKLPEHMLCQTAKKMDLMAVIRLKAKADGGVMEKALKLCMNSCYGKTVQQVGSHKYLNLFAASWITGTCRAIIARTIGQDKENSTISVMTDGILTRKPLEVKLGKALGEFEMTIFDQVIQFMPGVYYLKNSKTGKVESKYRGMDKNFEPEKAKSILWEEFREEKGKDAQGEPIKIKHGAYPVNINVFVTRNLALHQPKKFDAHRYEFYPVQKNEEFSLRSKRVPGKKGYRLLKKEQYKFFAPKTANPLELMVGGSKPYVLDLPDENQYDDADGEEEMLAESRMSTMLENEAYDLRG